MATQDVVGRGDTKHTLYELFLDNPSAEKVNRLNHTLNIQWAIDIKNSIKEI